MPHFPFIICLRKKQRKNKCNKHQNNFFLWLDLDECASAPCQNGGSCIDGVNGYTCQCTLEWSGDNCHVRGDCILNLNLTKSDLRLNTPYFPSNYLNNEFCQWIIHASAGKYIQLGFSAFHTELYYDYLDAGHGDDVTLPSSRVLHASGDEVPPPFISNQNSIWVTFRSDRTKTRQGVTFVLAEKDSPGKLQNLLSLNVFFFVFFVPQVA